MSTTAAPSIGDVDAMLRSAIDISSIGTAILDGFARPIYANDACVEILGITRDAMQGVSFVELAHPEDHTIDREQLCRLHAREMGSLINEWRLRSSGRSTVWLRSHLTLVSGGGIDEDGNLHLTDAVYLVQFEDVSERRRLESALSRSEETARSVVDALDQGVVLADSTGVVHRMNRAAVDALGMDHAELQRRWTSGEWEVLDEQGNELPPEKRPTVRAGQYREAVIAERVVWRRGDGEPMVARVSCIPGDFGLPIAEDATGILIGFTDITVERSVARLLEATLEMAPAGIAVLDGDTYEVVHCNQMFASQIGREVSELIGLDPVSLVGDEERRLELHDLADKARSRSGSAQYRQFHLVRPDGQQVWLEIRVSLVRSLERDLLIAVALDVTDRHRMIDALRRYRHLFRHANDLITVIGREGEVLFASPSHENLLGYRDDVGHPNGILGYLHPEDRARSARELAGLFAGAPTAGPFTMRACTIDGEWRYLETVAVNLLDEPSVRGVVLTSRDVTDREMLVHQLEHRASHDVLTELPNRMLFEERVNGALARAARSNGQIGLCYVDLDDFKKVNDRLGHHRGDAVLVEVADRLRRSIRGGDVAARIGGDEFVVILDPVADEDEALAVAARIRDALVHPPIIEVPGVRFGASVGVTVSAAGDTPDQLLMRADVALYRAKSARSSEVELLSAS